MKGTKCIYLDFGLRKGYINLNYIEPERRDIYTMSSKMWEKYCNNVLDAPRKMELEETMKQREYGLGMYLDHGKFTKRIQKDYVLKKLNIESTDNIGLLFTNLTWDASLVGADIIFKDPYEWVSRTINWFSDKEDRVLMIKVHPAETIHGTRNSFISYINEMHTDLPKNIIVLPPHTELSTYDLIDVADYGIIYTSTAGLEMALKGKPVITAAYTHFIKKGFTFDSKNYDNYFELLKMLNTLEMNQEMKEKALIYAYLHFCSREIPFKYLQFDNELFSSPRLNLQSYKDLSPGSDQILDNLCNAIINGNEFFMDEMGNRE